MIALDRIRQQGFKIRPTDTGIYIDPIDDLKPEQRLWIVDNKPQIRQQLLIERWRWFLSLAKEHDIHADVINAEYATESDRLDLIEPLDNDDARLILCMATLCRDTRVKRRQREYDAGRWVPVNPDGSLNH